MLSFDLTFYLSSLTVLRHTSLEDKVSIQSDLENAVVPLEQEETADFGK